MSLLKALVLISGQIAQLPAGDTVATWATIASKPTTLAGYSIAASDVLATLLTVDGPGSGLDADLLDGQSSAFYAPIANPFFTGGITTPQVSVNSTVPLIGLYESDQTTDEKNWDITVNSKFLNFRAVNDAYNASVSIFNVTRGTGTAVGPVNFTQTPTVGGVALLLSTGYTAADVLAKLLTVDGAGSGLDSDLLDGQSGAFYLAAANHTGFATIATSGLLSDAAFVLNTQSGTYTFVAADKGKTVRHNSGANHAWTIPPNLYAVGDRINYQILGGGTVTLTRGAGVVLVGVSGTDANYALLTGSVGWIEMIDTNVWIVDRVYYSSQFTTVGNSLAIASNAIANAQVSTSAAIDFSKLATMAADTVLGRSHGGGTGVPVVLSVSNLFDIMAGATYSGTGNLALTANGTPPTGVTYAGGGQAYNYVVMGKLIYVWGRLTLTSKGASGVGTVIATGLPFSSASGNHVQTGFRWNGATLPGTTNTQIQTLVSGTQMSFQYMTNTGVSDLLWSAITNGFDFVWSALYALP